MLLRCRCRPSMHCALAGHYGGCSVPEQRNSRFRPKLPERRNSGNSGFRRNSGSAVINSQDSARFNENAGLEFIIAQFVSSQGTIICVGLYTAQAYAKLYRLKECRQLIAIIFRRGIESSNLSQYELFESERKWPLLFDTLQIPELKKEASLLPL